MNIRPFKKQKCSSWDYFDMCGLSASNETYNHQTGRPTYKDECWHISTISVQLSSTVEMNTIRVLKLCIMLSCQCAHLKILSHSRLCKCHSGPLRVKGKTCLCVCCWMPGHGQEQCGDTGGSLPCCTPGLQQCK